MAQADFGVIGLAVMGRNLALNIESRGYDVAVYNRSRVRTEDLIKKHADKRFVPSYTVDAFVKTIKTPRRILLMVKAGQGTDAVIDELLPHLAKGDMLIDGGNNYFEDTIRRSDKVAQSGINFIGMGVSGGELGALKGPSLMPGGQREAYDLVAPILKQIAARAPEDDKPTVTYVGPNGAVHYVKMVHHGIEYGDIDAAQEDIRKALYFGKIMSYAQGFDQLRMASDHYDWHLPFGELAQLWRAGAIVRAQFLQRITDAFAADNQLHNLLLDHYFKGISESYQDAARRVVALSVTAGVPTPSLSAAIAYYDSYRSAVLPANLIQAQRDYFGAYLRTYR